MLLNLCLFWPKDGREGGFIEEKGTFKVAWGVTHIAVMLINKNMSKQKNGKRI